MAYQHKLHTRIDQLVERALCGAHPERDFNCQVVTNTEFVALPAEQRCGRCVALYKKHGYKIDTPAKKTARKSSPYRATAAYYRQQP